MLSFFIPRWFPMNLITVYHNQKRPFMKVTITVFNPAGEMLKVDTLELQHGNVPPQEFVENLFKDFRVHPNDTGYVLRPYAFPGAKIPDEAVLAQYEPIAASMRVEEAGEVEEGRMFVLETDTRGDDTMVRIVHKNGGVIFGTAVGPSDIDAVSELAEVLFEAAEVVTGIYTDLRNKQIVKPAAQPAPMTSDETFGGPGEEATPAAEPETLDDYMASILVAMPQLRYRGSFDSRQGDPWSGTYHNGDVVVRDESVCILANKQWFKRALSADKEAMVDWLKGFLRFVPAAITPELLTAMGYNFRGELPDNKAETMQGLQGKEWDVWLTPMLVLTYISGQFITWNRNDADTVNELFKMAAPDQFQAVAGAPKSPAEQASELLSQIGKKDAAISQPKGSENAVEIPEGHSTAYLDFALAAAPGVTIYRYLFVGAVRELIESGFIALVAERNRWQQNTNFIGDRRHPVMIIERDDVSVMAGLRSALAETGLEKDIKLFRRAEHMPIEKGWFPMA